MRISRILLFTIFVWLTAESLLAASIPGAKSILTFDNYASILKPQFRVESTPLPGGIELFTIKVKLPGRENMDEEDAEYPLLSLLKDTLGKPDRETHRIRMLWGYGITRPSLTQKIVSLVPFFYAHVGGNLTTVFPFQLRTFPNRPQTFGGTPLLLQLESLYWRSNPTLSEGLP